MREAPQGAFFVSDPMWISCQTRVHIELLTVEASVMSFVIRIVHGMLNFA